ncbi:MAG TPA: DUF6152 family protein [Terriglobia bacterium]|nr:DUF6152 family protein [Terriglobia bacterium]
MRIDMALMIVGLALLLSPEPMTSHHSFTAEYDSAKLMQFMGTITKVEWTNPHARFYLDVKDARGAVTNWNFELGSPILLRKLGWKQDSLKIGEQVSVEGYLAKDGAKMANARKVTLADGRNIFAGSSADGNPTR